MKITIIGSVNTDMTIRVSGLPSPGETVLGDAFCMCRGGKGGNQAVAAARLGGDVTFVCKVGNDIFGQQSLKDLSKEKIDLSHALIDTEHSTGVALILVDSKGENSIAVAPCANSAFKVDDISDTLIASSDLILLQMEIPLPVIESVISKARLFSKKVILNPAPAFRLGADSFENLYLITPNQTEAEFFTGIHIDDQKSASLAAQKFFDMGVGNVVITMGSKGAYYNDGVASGVIPCPSVKPVDTTGAGDVFNGALVVALSEGHDLSDAVRFANKAASMSVLKYGAADSAPHRNEIN